MDQKSQILNIGMNLNRIGNLAADDFDKKEKRIRMFMEQTSDYVEAVDKSTLPIPFKKTYLKFLTNWEKLRKMEKIENKDSWAEKMMTWGNILTHRTKLL